MSLSRRQFLEVASMVAASSAVPLQGASTSVHAIDPSFERTSLHGLSFNEVDRFVGETFSVEAGFGRPLQMVLASVEELPRYDDGAAGEAFLMNFCLRLGASLPQGTYIFDNPKIGRCSLLIAPSGSKTKNYAAVINHRRPA